MPRVVVPKWDSGRRKSTPDDPWFPDVVIEQIRALVDADVEPESPLIEVLWRAVQLFVESRQDARVGVPELNFDQRHQLEGIMRAAVRLRRSCGPDPEMTQRIIGNWAEAGFLKGGTLTEILDWISELETEIAQRLFEEPRPRRRPTDVALRRLCLDIAVALDDAGEQLTKSRKSSLAQMIKLLLTSTGERVPRDVFALVRMAVDELPSEQRRRQQERDDLVEFFSEPKELLD